MIADAVAEDMTIIKVEVAMLQFRAAVKTPGQYNPRADFFSKN